MKLREERRDVALEMARLWKEDPAEWLVRSKAVWTARHDSKRPPKRAGDAGPRVPWRQAAAERAAAAAAAAGGGGDGDGDGTGSTPTAGGGGGGGNPRAAYGSKRPAGGGGKPGRSTVSLKMLMDDGRMASGPEKLWITYQNQTWSGELDEEGAIIFEGKTFQSPSAWAIYVKRLAGSHVTQNHSITRSLAHSRFVYSRST